jgi:hypothetical protein
MADADAVSLHAGGEAGTHTESRESEESRGFCQVQVSGGARAAPAHIRLLTIETSRSRPKPGPSRGATMNKYPRRRRPPPAVLTGRGTCSPAAHPTCQGQRAPSGPPPGASPTARAPTSPPAASARTPGTAATALAPPTPGRPCVRSRRPACRRRRCRRPHRLAPLSPGPVRLLPLLLAALQLAALSLAAETAFDGCPRHRRRQPPWLHVSTPCGRGTPTRPPSRSSSCRLPCPPLALGPAASPAAAATVCGLSTT